MKLSELQKDFEAVDKVPVAEIIEFREKSTFQTLPREQKTTVVKQATEELLTLLLQNAFLRWFLERPLFAPVEPVTIQLGNTLAPRKIGDLVTIIRSGVDEEVRKKMVFVLLENLPELEVANLDRDFFFGYSFHLASILTVERNLTGFVENLLNSVSSVLAKLFLEGKINQELIDPYLDENLRFGISLVLPKLATGGALDEDKDVAVFLKATEPYSKTLLSGRTYLASVSQIPEEPQQPNETKENE